MNHRHEGAYQPHWSGRKTAAQLKSLAASQGELRMKDSTDGLDDLQRAEWSRHFETIQWGVIAIFTAGVGAILAASQDDANSTKVWPELAGLALIVVGVFYVASLRGFRRQLEHSFRGDSIMQPALFMARREVL